jgi:membrane fusion protein (multidrug efflux system)
VLVAPEMKAQLAEAESKAQAAASQRAEAVARLAAAQATYDRLKEAAKTPGAIAGNELIQAQTTVESAQAAVESAQNSMKAAQAAVEATRDLQSYLGHGSIRWRDYRSVRALGRPGRPEYGSAVEARQ